MYVQAIAWDVAEGKAVMMRRLRRLMSLYTQTKLLVWDLYGFAKLFDYEQLLEEEDLLLSIMRT